MPANHSITNVLSPNFKHFRVPNLLHSSTRPRCGIRRSDLAIYISCATESERLIGFFCILGVWFHVSLKSRTLQDPHAAGMSKMDFLFVYFSKLQGGLPRHSRKSLIYCLIKIHLYPLYPDEGVYLVIMNRCETYITLSLMISRYVSWVFDLCLPFQLCVAKIQMWQNTKEILHFHYCTNNWVTRWTNTNTRKLLVKWGSRMVKHLSRSPFLFGTHIVIEQRTWHMLMTVIWSKLSIFASLRDV